VGGRWTAATVGGPSTGKPVHNDWKDMPNWVHNRIVATGPKDALDTLEKKLHSEEEPVTFNNILSRPPEQDDDWYNWNIAHWGTKWDAVNAYRSRADDGTLDFSFDTAWSPPFGVIDALFEQFKDLDFEYFYEEEQGWGGNVVFKNGAIAEQETYDIPDSHKEMAERRGGCWCTTEEAVFDDCFAEQAAERGVSAPEILEAVKALSPGWGGNVDELIEAAARL
jgi:hypothetical protein